MITAGRPRRPLSKRLLPSSSSLFLLLFSIQSFHAPSFPLLPFTLLVSLLSTLLTFLLTPQTLTLILTPSLALKSLLLALVLLLRFQSLLSCASAASLLLDFSGSLAARSLLLSSSPAPLLLSLAPPFLLFFGWKQGCSVLFAFLSGFLGFAERSWDWEALRPLGRRKVRLFSLAFATVWLLVPALVGYAFGGFRKVDVSGIGSAVVVVNTVVFGVVLGDNNGEERAVPSPVDLRGGLVSTLVCTVALELFYFPGFSVVGFVGCGFLLWVAVDWLDSPSCLESGICYRLEFFGVMVLRPICGVLGERKFRRIVISLLVNMVYVVVEFVVGFRSNSLGLISDACCMLFRCSALASGLYASYFSRILVNSRFNYGWGRFEVLFGYISAVFSVLVGAHIVFESIKRIMDPLEVSTDGPLVVAIGGLLVNVVCWVLLPEEHHKALDGRGLCSQSHLPLHHNNKVNGRVTDVNSGQLISQLTSMASITRSPDSIDCSWLDLGDNCHCGVHSTETDENATETADCSALHLRWSSEKKVNVNPMEHHVGRVVGRIFLRVLANSMGIIGVIISTYLIKYKGWLIADPACSIFICAMIISYILPFLTETAETLLQRVSKHLKGDLKMALNYISRIDGVYSVQNVHIWNITSSEIVGALHLHVSTGNKKEGIKKKVSKIMHDIGIEDLTIQVEHIHA